MRTLVPILFALTACLDSLGPSPEFHVAGRWNHWSYFPNVSGEPCYVVGTLEMDSTLPDNMLTGSFEGLRACGQQLKRGATWTVVTRSVAGQIDSDSLTLAMNLDLALRGAWSITSMNGTASLSGSAGHWNAVSCSFSSCASASLLQARLETALNLP